MGGQGWKQSGLVFQLLLDVLYYLTYYRKHTLLFHLGEMWILQPATVKRMGIGMNQRELLLLAYRAGVGLL